MKFGRFFLFRGAQLCVTTILVVALTFALLHIGAEPQLRERGDSEGIGFRRDLDPSTRAVAFEYLGLDRALFWETSRGTSSALSPFLESRFGRWLGRVWAFDLGVSTTYQRPVWDLLRERLPRSLLLDGSAVLLAFLLAVPAGLGLAHFPGHAIDRIVQWCLGILHALPEFWVASVVLSTGSVPLDGFHSRAVLARLREGSLSPWSWEAGMDLARQIAVPVLILTYGLLAYLVMQTRSSVLGILKSGHVRDAEARGESRMGIAMRHGLRGAAPRLVGLLALLVPGVLAGSVLVESMFGLPGMGLLLFDAAVQGDVPVVMGGTLVFALVTGVAMAASDVAVARLDPRVRLATS